MQFNTATISHQHYGKTDSYMTQNSGDATGMMGNKRELEILETRSENSTEIGLVFCVTDKTYSVQYGFENQHSVFKYPDYRIH
jgi:hypothetical protein